MIYYMIFKSIQWLVQMNVFFVFEQKQKCFYLKSQIFMIFGPHGPMPKHGCLGCYDLPVQF